MDVRVLRKRQLRKDGGDDVLRRRFDCFLDEDLDSGEAILCEKYDGLGVGRDDWLPVAVEGYRMLVGAVAWSVWRKVAT